jgi:ABC-type branched-subunit amino acid transport system permease subunit
VAVIVGGSAMIMGPIVGGAFVALLPFLLETMADLSFILKGLILIAVLIFAPAGICELIARPFKSWRQIQIQSAGKETLSNAPSAVSHQQ